MKCFLASVNVHFSCAIYAKIFGQLGTLYKYKFWKFFQKMWVVENWNKSLDNSGIVGTILMDLSKACDCLPYDPLISKLAAYRFSISSLCLVYDYLINSHQAVQIASTQSYLKKYLWRLHKGQYWDPCYSIYSSMTRSFLGKALRLYWW